MARDDDGWRDVRNEFDDDARSEQIVKGATFIVNEREWGEK